MSSISSHFVSHVPYEPPIDFNIPVVNYRPDTPELHVTATIFKNAISEIIGYGVLLPPILLLSRKVFLIFFPTFTISGLFYPLMGSAVITHTAIVTLHLARQFLGNRPTANESVEVPSGISLRLTLWKVIEVVELAFRFLDRKTSSFLKIRTYAQLRSDNIELGRYTFREVVRNSIVDILHPRNEILEKIPRSLSVLLCKAFRIDMIAPINMMLWEIPLGLVLNLVKDLTAFLNAKQALEDLIAKQALENHRDTASPLSLILE